jgi:uncharacterized protein (TIGR01777 family)
MGQAEDPDRSLNVVITGAVGLIGGLLVPYLTARGHTVRRLTRQRSDPTRDDLNWQPAEGRLDPSHFDGVDAVVHLAGEPIAGRWTRAKKARIRESRVVGTSLLARTLAARPEPPVLVSASGVGYYGHSEQTGLSEDAPSGRGFLALVCREWEAATSPVSDAGGRVVVLRLGAVLSVQGGALAKLLPPARWGLTGPVGGGSQAMPWIGEDDLIAIIARALSDTCLSGPVNAVAPDRVTNRDFMTTLGRVLGRPSFLPLPRPMVQLLFGEMGRALLLDGADVAPTRLLSLAHRWIHPNLEEALTHLLRSERT